MNKFFFSLLAPSATSTEGGSFSTRLSAAAAAADLVLFAHRIRKKHFEIEKP